MEETPDVPEILDEFDLPARGEATSPPPPAAESVGEAVEDVKERATTVSRRELEDFLAQAVNLFLRGGLHVHHDGNGNGLPDLELRLTEDTLVVNLRNLDSALAWQLASGPADVAPPTEKKEQVLDRWRFFLLIEDEPVAALGRGIPGVQVRTGKASFLLFKDFLKGLVADKSAATREKIREHRRELLEKEIRHSRKRTGASVPDLKPPTVDPGEERLPGPNFRPGRA